MNGNQHTTQKLLDCPACRNPIHGHFALAIEMEPSDVANVDITGRVDATVRVTGVRVEHDCTPKVKRDSLTERGR